MLHTLATSGSLHRVRTRFIILLGIWLCCTGLAIATTEDKAEKTTVYLYTYHNKPPFIADLPNRTGLYYDFATLLSSKSDRYRFITTYLPRKRLDRLLQSNRLEGVVLGATPSWFDDMNEERYLWLPGFFDDADEFVSLRSQPFEYDGEASLRGKTLAGVAGYFYYGVERAVQSGNLHRIDTIGEREVLTLIEKGRVDMGIVSTSVFKYLRRQAEIQDTFHFSARQHEAFQRRAFTSLRNRPLHQHMQILMQQVILDGSWDAMVAGYQ